MTKADATTATATTSSTNSALAGYSVRAQVQTADEIRRYMNRR